LPQEIISLEKGVLNDNPTKFLEKKLFSLKRKGLSGNSTQVPSGERD